LTGLGPKRGHKHLAALSYQDEFARVGRQRHADASPDHHDSSSHDVLSPGHSTIVAAAAVRIRLASCQWGGGCRFASCQRNGAAAWLGDGTCRLARWIVARRAVHRIGGPAAGGGGMRRAAAWPGQFKEKKVIFFKERHYYKFRFSSNDYYQILQHHYYVLLPITTE
jgi:hypothetical protein